MEASQIEAALAAIAALRTDFGALQLAVGLGFATFLAEDLTCIAAGLLVANGRLSFVTAAVACFFGILVGDLLLVAAGRILGRPALRKRPLRWFVSPESVERAGHWFHKSGTKVIFLSRFVPGSRLPLFVAAGVVHAPLPRLAATLAAAAAIWTPGLVGLSAATGGAIQTQLELWEKRALLLVLLATAIVLLVVKVLVPALTWRGRRLLLSRWRRTVRWEFWPLWLFQMPVVLHWLWLGLRHRDLTLFTAANPGIPAGGFVLESKTEILTAVGDPEAVPRFTLLRLPEEIEARVRLVSVTHAEMELGYPVVGKPDVGERGEGVTILRTPAELETWARRAPRDAVLQEYVGGEEFGVFYLRRPGASQGEIFSITSKRFPEVIGDGHRDLEELILADDRAVCMAPLYLEQNVDRLEEIPAAGERVPLVEIGNHCRGTVFLDGRALATPELAERIDAIATSFPGFHFGRFDVRVPSREAFRAGRDLRVLEINGVTSEATHIYEPGASLRAAYRTLFEQWRLAFAIGAANHAQGAPVTRVGELLHLLGERRQRARRAGAVPDEA